MTMSSSLASRSLRDSLSVLSRSLKSGVNCTCSGKTSRTISQKKRLIHDAKTTRTCRFPSHSRSFSTSSKSPSEVLESFANLDHSRSTRTGFPEAVFAQGKTAQQIAAILDDMADHVNKSLKDDGKDANPSHKSILATRVSEELYNDILKFPLKNGSITYHETAKIISMRASSLEETESEPVKPFGKIIVACAGTTDLPVAEEAAVTLEAAGCGVERLYDVGVAGLHRIVGALPTIRDPEVDCIIVCAGMDGALPSVVAGLVTAPVVAVPTSIGYGASFSGVSAMLTMLNSCAPGVGVVNIDNGFGGAALAFKCIKR